MRKFGKSLEKRIRFVTGVVSGIGKTEVLVLGDSHASVFSQRSASIPGYRFAVKAVPGATISGLKNPNSETQAMPIFRKALNRFRGRICLTLIGEVDTGFVIWYRAQKYQTSIEEMLQTTVDHYIDFIASLPSDLRVIVLSAPLPTIQDGQEWGEVANARCEVNASQRERTDLTVEFNRRMQLFAEQNGHDYINLDGVSLGEHGIVKSELLNDDTRNHHYNSQGYLSLILPRLEETLKTMKARTAG